MEIPRVMMVGITVAVSAADGYYDCVCWFRCSGSAQNQQEAYERLTWPEVCQVMDMALGGRRPGFELYSDGWQPTLWARG